MSTKEEIQSYDKSLSFLFLPELISKSTSGKIDSRESLYFLVLTNKTQEEKMSETTEKKNKKIAKMNLSEVEAAIKKATENQNNETTRYVIHLNKRKEELTSAGK